jgi:hypothetical protein
MKPFLNNHYFTVKNIRFGRKWAGLFRTFRGESKLKGRVFFYASALVTLPNGSRRYVIAGFL